jgi:hypothetical protein
MLPHEKEEKHRRAEIRVDAPQHTPVLWEQRQRGSQRQEVIDCIGWQGRGGFYFGAIASNAAASRSLRRSRRHS